MDPHRGLTLRGDRSLCAILELWKSRQTAVKMKVKPSGTDGFLADNHLFDLHDLGHVIGGRFERCLTRSVVDADKHLPTDVISAVNTCTTKQHTQHERVSE